MCWSGHKTYLQYLDHKNHNDKLHIGGMGGGGGERRVFILLVPRPQRRVRVMAQAVAWPKPHFNLGIFLLNKSRIVQNQ